MKCSGYCANALHKERYFIDWLKEISELAKLVPVVFGKEVILMNIRLLVALVERQGILKVDATVDH